MEHFLEIWNVRVPASRELGIVLGEQGRSRIQTKRLGNLDLSIIAGLVVGTRWHVTGGTVVKFQPKSYLP